MREKKKNSVAKEVEVKSIKIIEEDMSINTADEELRRVDFDLGGKQKEEIEITISPAKLKELEREKKRQLAEEKKNRKKEEKAERKLIKERRNSREEAQGVTMPEFMFINVGAVIIVALAIIFSLYFLERSSGYSEHEKRMLYEFPELTVESYFDGSFTKGVSDYFTDTVPNREKLKLLCNRFKGLLGFSVDGNAIVGNSGAEIKHEKFEGEINTQKPDIYVPGMNTGTENSGTQTTPQSSVTTPQSTTPPESSATKKPDKDKPVQKPGDALENGILIINKGTDEVRAMELYGGSFAAGKKYAKTLNKYKTDLSEKLDGKVNVYAMCIPMAVAYYLPEEFEDQSASIYDNILNINSYLDGVVSVDAYNALKAHTNEYIYSRTDHHWQPLGAYYAAQAFAKAALVDFAPLESYEKKTKTGFVGTLYGHTGDAELEQNPDKFVYYVPQNNYTTYNYNSKLENKTESILMHEYASGANTYSMFLGNDNIVAQIDTDVKNGRTLVVFKDSFGNALVPFLTGSFEHIYVVDYRYCDFNAVDFCTQVKATDVLFATSMFSCTASDKVQVFEQNRTK